LGQPGNSVNVIATGGGDKDLSFETAPETDANSSKYVENSISKEGKVFEEVSKETEEEDGLEDKEKNKEVVDVDELDLHDIPRASTLGDGVAKRLRSNKEIIVIPKKMTTLVTETPKSRTKPTWVGPKKGWSKVSVKTTTGSSRKRKVVSCSDSAYEVEEDILHIVSCDAKRSTGKKNFQTVENVPIDKVSFHFPESAQRWKFFYHRRLAVERKLTNQVL